MSLISKETISKAAKLANIKIEDSEKEYYCEQLTKITNWVEKLNEVDTNNVEILSNVHGNSLTLFPDEVDKTNEIEAVLSNAPSTEYNYFAVPKVIE
jgi:aspartyl-tRNA(Asn)/glutamyl-tRNA(Gln) amidotransferase subunit C